MTGDAGVLDESVPFLDGPELHAGEVESFFQPTVSGQRATIFDHCALALDDSLALGVHGIPLFGSGDWNDGMNRVGEAGKGESIWLGWFLYTTLLAFAPLADSRGDARGATWRNHATALAASLDHEGWDGKWYRRGYFDDGTPLGSAGSIECRIDSIAQSWSVISGAASPERGAAAMAAVDEYLVKREDGLVLLFTPPFDHTPLDPGYIKGYPPGLRENGGQYTHGALWSVIAFAMLGDGNKAGELFSILNPINHANTRAANSSLQSGAIRRMRRRVLDAAACRAWRMDLVLGLGGMDVSRGSRMDIGLSSPRQNVANRSMHPERVAGLRDCLSIRFVALRNRGRKSTQSQPRSIQRRA